MIFGLIWTLFLGGLAGWIAGRLMGKGDGSVVGNIILGLIGGVVGSVVLGIFGIHGSGLVGGTLVSVAGACLLIWLKSKL